MPPKKREAVKGGSPTGKKPFQATLKKLEGMAERLANPQQADKLLTQIGTFLVIQATQAFTNQKLPGLKKWKAKYPNQKSPKFNIAGAISDFASGRSEPKRNRYQDRPALEDTGNLKKWWSFDNVSHSVTPKGRFVVEVGAGGAVKDYAGLMQWGGTAKQTLTADIKKKMNIFLKKTRGTARKAEKRDGQNSPAAKSARKSLDAASKMGYLLNRKFKITVKKTKVNPRPFLGITPQVDKDIRAIIEQEIPGNKGKNE